MLSPFTDRRRHRDAFAVAQRELQPVGVQEHALRARARAVRAVADDGVAFVGGVYADLVTSSSNELGLDECVRPAVFHAAESCVGVVAVGTYDHGFRCSRDRGLYVACTRPASLHDCAVDADHVLLAESSLQVAQLCMVERDQQRPGRLLIDAVRKLSVGVYVADALDNAAPRPGSRMHRHPRRLIYYQCRRPLPQHLKLVALTFRRPLRFLTELTRQRDHVPSPDAVILLDTFLVDTQRPLACELEQHGRRARGVAGEELVYPPPVVVLRDRDR